MPRCTRPPVEQSCLRRGRFHGAGGLTMAFTRDIATGRPTGIRTPTHTRTATVVAATGTPTATSTSTSTPTSTATATPTPPAFGGPLFSDGFESGSLPGAWTSTSVSSGNSLSVDTTL